MVEEPSAECVLMSTMTGSQTYLSLFLILASVVVAVFAFTRWQIRHVRPTAATGAMLMWAGAFWMLCNAIEMAVVDIGASSLWNRLQYVAIIAIPTLWMYMSLQFVGREAWMTRTRWLLFGLISLFSLVVILTSDAHRLFYARSEVVTAGSTIYVDHTPGIFLILIYIFGYIQVFFGASLLVQRVSRAAGFRYQGAIILFGVLFSVTANILDWTRLNPAPYVKLTPIALSISVPLFALTLIQTRRMDIIPVARSTIIQSMDDPVVVMDHERRVMDMNPAAENLIGLSLDRAVGQTIDAVWPVWTAQIDTVFRRPLGTNELRIGSGTDQRIFDLRPSELPDWQGKFVSRVVVFREITERVKAELRLRASLRDKEVLLKEIHHRVKNNLQVTASMLSLQSNLIADDNVRDLFQESQNRIRAIALIHELLYRSSDLERIDLEEYITNLTTHLFQSHGIQSKGIAVTLVTEQIFVDIDSAVPCGLIVNELVSNAMKHAFPDGHTGTVSIELHQNDSMIGLIVRDTGVGIDREIDFRNSATLGLQLVSSLVRQLDGEINLRSDSGTTFEVQFKVQNIEAEPVAEVVP